MSVKSVRPGPESEVVSLKISSISPSATNPRKRFDQGALDELAASIVRHGVLQPILVRPRQASGAAFEIVAGERRYRAAAAAGLEEIPATVRELTDLEALEIQVVENLQREDLHPLEEAEGYARLHRDHSYRVEDLALKVGRSESYVYARMKLLDLPDEAKESMLEGRLPFSTALLIARLPRKEDREAATGEILNEKQWDDESGGFVGGRVMSHDDAHHYVRSEFYLRLADARFPLDDPSLYPAAGSCVDCPKRTGNQPGLFSDVKTEDVCLDKACFEQKKALWWKRLKAEASERGRTVVEGREALKYVIFGRGTAGHVSLDERCWRDPKSRHWRAVLGKACPEPVLVLDEEGKVHEVVSAATAMEAAALKGYKWAEEDRRLDASSAAKRKRELHERKVRAGAAEKIVEAVALKWVQGFKGLDAPACWTFLVLAAIKGQWTAVVTKVAREWRYQTSEELIDEVEREQLSVEDLQILFLEIITYRAIDELHYTSSGVPPFVLRFLGRDYAEIEKEVIEELRLAKGTKRTGAKKAKAKG